MPTPERLLPALSRLLSLLLWLAATVAVCSIGLGAVAVVLDLADRTDDWDGFVAAIGIVAIVAGLILLAASVLPARAVGRGRRRLDDTGDADPLFQAAFAAACAHGILALVSCSSAVQYDASGAWLWPVAGGVAVVAVAAATATAARRAIIATIAAGPHATS